MSNIAIGDRITFRAVTRHGAPKLTRKVIGFRLGDPVVRAHGWPDFVVLPHEIKAVIAAESPQPI
jgi:hypothetical protein